MRLTDRQRAILVGIASDVSRLAARPLPCGYDTHRERQAITDAKSNIVRSEPSRWLHTALTPSLHVMLGRDYRKLESLGLITRHAFGLEGGRQTHLGITAAGRDVAQQLAAEQTTEAASDA
jgi:hypothetical protein